MLNSDLDRLTSGSDSKESVRNAGDPGLIPGSWRSLGEGKGYPHKYSCLENLTDSPGKRSLVGYSPWGCKEPDMTEWLTIDTHTHIHTHTHTHAGSIMAVMVEVATRMGPVWVMFLLWRYRTDFFFFLLSMGRSILMRNSWKVSHLFLYPVIFIPFTNQESWLPS